MGGTILSKGFFMVKSFDKKIPINFPISARGRFFSPVTVSNVFLQWANIWSTSIFPQRRCEDELKRSKRSSISTVSFSVNRFFMFYGLVNGLARFVEDDFCCPRILSHLGHG